MYKINNSAKIPNVLIILISILILVSCNSENKNPPKKQSGIFVKILKIPIRNLAHLELSVLMLQGRRRHYGSDKSYRLFYLIKIFFKKRFFSIPLVLPVNDSIQPMYLFQGDIEYFLSKHTAIPWLSVRITDPETSICVLV